LGLKETVAVSQNLEEKKGSVGDAKYCYNIASCRWVQTPPSAPLRTYQQIQGQILIMLLELKGQGCSESTLKAMGRKLRGLARNVNLQDPEAVRTYIADQPGV